MKNVPTYFWYPMFLYYKWSTASLKPKALISKWDKQKVLFFVVHRVWLFATPWAVARQTPLSMGILQARILEWVAMPFSRGSS